ncbi:MAG: hypothetical protein MUF87_17520 [Anaerolineae bacterium]|jgi:hypothetical protein|nr:hypothetical protein [Anaerolineae bacterium]
MIVWILILVWLQTLTPTPSPTPLPSTDDLVKARFVTDTPAPLTGKAFTLTLIVELPPEAELVEFPTFPAQWGLFEVMNVGAFESRLHEDGWTIVEQPLTVRLWQPLAFRTPDTFISYRTAAITTPQNIPVTPLTINVPTVLDFEDQTLRSFKPLIDLPYVSPWLILALISGIGTLGGYSYHRWQLTRSKGKRLTVSIPPSPAQIALDSLAHLKTMHKPTDYPMIADILRDYVRDRFEIALTTTADTIEELRPKLPEKSLADLQRILTDADLVKFAQVQVDPQMIGRVIDFARRWIIATEEQINVKGNS